MRSAVTFEQLFDLYQAKFPISIKNSDRDIGIEEELPLVDDEGNIANFAELHPLISQSQTSWGAFYDDVNTKVLNGFYNQGDIITTDASFGTIEIAAGPRKNMHEVAQARTKLIGMVAGIAHKKGFKLLGYGIQPNCIPQRKLWWPKGRYALLWAQLPPGVDLATISASSQTHVKLGRTEIADFINICNAFSGLMTALTPNSPIWLGGMDKKGRRAVRNTFWDQIAEADRVGIPRKPFTSFEDMLARLLKIRFIMYRENGKYLQYHQSFNEFIAGRFESDINFVHQSLLMHEACNWWDARPRASFGTAEVRLFCQQPPRDGVAVHALILGLACNIGECLELMNEYRWEDWRSLRSVAQVAGFDARISRDPIIPLLDRLVQIAYRGLESRSLGEEIYLSSFLERLHSKLTPADQAIKIFSKRGVPGLVGELAYRPQ